MRDCRAAVTALVLMLAACSGGGSGSSPEPTGGSIVSGSLSLAIPAKSAARANGRRPHFISPSVASVSIAVTGIPQNVVADVGPTSPNCTSTTTGRTCSVAVQAPTGSASLTATLYDKAGATGNVLGQGTATASIAADFNVSISVAGVPGAIVLATAVTSFVAGTAASTPLVVTVNDADGNTITGTYKNPITLANSDTTGAFSLSATSVASSAQTVTLNYNGSAAVAKDVISGSAPGVAPGSITAATLIVGSADNIYAAELGNQAVTVTPATGNGNVAPLRAFATADTGQDYGLTVDPTGNIYVSQLRGGGVHVFANTATGAATVPLRTINGAATGLVAPLGLAIDKAGELIVGNFGANSITVYAPGANGNVAPIRTIAGNATGLSAIYGLTLDAAGKIYVVDNNQGGFDAVTVYAANANGNAAPLQTIFGTNTGLDGAVYDAVDSAGKIYVTSALNDTVRIFAAGATGNVAPIATISGPKTTLISPGGIFVDAAGLIYVGNNSPTLSQNSIVVFPAGANGNVAPLRTIIGSNTQVNYACQLFVAP
jgi:hypothetical protein